LLSGKRIKVQETGKSFQVYIPIIEYNIQPWRL
jgi:hypothetical protein